MFLLFVYNENSGFFDKLQDGVSKIAGTHGSHCKLCGLTFGAFSMKREWRKFLDGLEAETRFMHRDEYEKVYGDKVPLPTVFVLEYDEKKVLVGKEDFDTLKSLKELMELITERLKETQPTDRHLDSDQP